MARIFLHPGYVISKNDGQRHFVNAQRLADLYNVYKPRCIVVLPESEKDWQDLPGDIHLHPRYNGNYQSFRKEQEQEN
jgi:hypothetical protein